MASTTIITTPFRASHVHLDKPHTFDQTKPPKYKLEMMFPKSGMGIIGKTGQQVQSSAMNIKQAIDEVAMQEFGFAPSQIDPKQYGIQFPPNFKDGDQKLQKDSNGYPIPGTVDPISAGYEILAVNNDNRVGVVAAINPTVAIDPSAVYSGMWCMAQLEVSAFVSKATNSRIISVTLLNVMTCYDDEPLGRAPVQDATSAFAGTNVPNSNLSSGFGQGGPMQAPALQPQGQYGQQQPNMPQQQAQPQGQYGQQQPNMPQQQAQPQGQYGQQQPNMPQGQYGQQQPNMPQQQAQPQAQYGQQQPNMPQQQAQPQAQYGQQQPNMPQQQAQPQGQYVQQQPVNYLEPQGQ